MDLAIQRTAGICSRAVGKDANFSHIPVAGSYAS
jgi:hypothetical protein